MHSSTTFMLAGLLLLAGCSHPADGENQAHRAVTDQGALPSAGIPPIAIERAARLARFDENSYIALLGHTGRPMNAAAHRARLVTGAFPATLGELAPYCFFWPAQTGDGAKPIPLGDTPPTAPIPVEDWETASPTLYGRPHPDAPPTFVMPYFREHLSSVSFIESQKQDRAGEINPRAFLPPALAKLERLTPSTLAELLAYERSERRAKVESTVWQRYQASTRHPDDARLAELAAQLTTALSTAALNTGRLPVDLHELTWFTGLTPINVASWDGAANPGQGTLKVSTDTKHRRFRFELEFTSGLRVDYVQEFESPTLSQVKCDYMSWAIFTQQQSGTFVPFAAWSLVPLPQATLPGLPASGVGPAATSGAVTQLANAPGSAGQSGH